MFFDKLTLTNFYNFHEIKQYFHFMCFRSSDALLRIPPTSIVRLRSDITLHLKTLYVTNPLAK